MYKFAQSSLCSKKHHECCMRHYCVTAIICFCDKGLILDEVVF